MTIEQQHALDELTIREVHPNATWMPWDTCPIGTRVLLRADCEGKRPSGVIIGVFDPPPRQHIHTYCCPSCTCSKEWISKGWWEVKLDVPVLGRCGEAAIDTVIEYPPTLIPIKEEK
jgi:hypothetical protein